MSSLTGMDGIFRCVLAMTKFEVVNGTIDCVLCFLVHFDILYNTSK